MPKSINNVPKLAEAWLTVKWKLEHISGMPDLLRDIAYPLVVGAFRDAIRTDFPMLNELDANRAPLDLLPYVPRLQFKSSNGAWPLIQLGPGLATLNFVNNYSWTDFKKNALLLRKKLAEVYTKENQPLALNLLSLRYRYAFDFDYSNENILDFYKNKLNVAITLPENITAPQGKIRQPEEASFTTNYALQNNLQGILRLVNGTERRGEKNVKVLLVETEVICNKTQIENTFASKEPLDGWLNEAHDISVSWLSELGVRDLA